MPTFSKIVPILVPSAFCRHGDAVVHFEWRGNNPSLEYLPSPIAKKLEFDRSLLRIDGEDNEECVKIRKNL